MSFPLRWGAFLIVGVVGCGEYREPLAPAAADPTGPQAGPPPGGGSPPIVTVTSPSGGATLVVGAPVLFSADFTDPDVADTHTCSFDWQGSSSPGAVTESGGSGTCTISQTFPSAGGYQIVVSVFDNAGEMGADTVDITIATAPPPPPPPPSAGRTVHGEGHLASPRHRHGVRFHLAARAAIERRPTTGGLRVEAGAFRFESTAIEQLMFSGDRADVTGRGRVARRGPVSFAISLVDGDRSATPGPDRVRIRIWNAQEVLLDTEPGLAQSTSPRGVPNPGRVVIRP